MPADIADISRSQIHLMKQQETHRYSDEAIRRFLLGNLQRTERTRFEQSLFMDEAFDERVRLAELELSDDYAAGRLVRAERKLFQERFLLTADRKLNLATSAALHDKFRFSQSPSHASWSLPATKGFDFRRYRWRYAFAALVLLLLVAGAVLITKDHSHIAVPFIPKRFAPKPSPTATPQLTNHATNPSAPAHSEAVPVLPSHEEPATPIRLASHTPLSAAPSIGINNNGFSFELILDQPVLDSYDVSVTTTAGEPVYAANAIKRSANGTLLVQVPPGPIRPGDFQINLTGIEGQSRRSAGIFYFRVR